MDFINGQYPLYQQPMQNNGYPQMNAYRNNYQPQPQPQVQQTPQNAYYYVNGIEGAKAFQLPAGKSVLLMDTDSPIFYLKSANEIGQATLKAYRFEEITAQPTVQTNYVTREEVEDMIKNYSNLASKTKKAEA